MTPVSTHSASAAERETPGPPSETIYSGVMSDDPHYRLTGNTEAPEKKTPAEPTAAIADKDSANQDQSGNDDASAASSSKAAPSESASTQRTEKRENRWQKREREVRELREENARLKAAKTETQQPEVRREPSQVSQPAAESKSKAAAKPKIDDKDEKTGQPKYKTYAEYEDAKDEWLRKETLREFSETSARSAQETQAQQQFQERATALNKKFDAVRPKYADFDQVALSEGLTIPAGSVTELFIHDSDHAGEVLYHLGQHPEILQGFYRNYDPKTGKFESLMTPQRQFRKLMEVEAQVSGGGSRSGGNGDGGRNSSSSSARPVTKASPPAHQVSGSGAVGKDAVEQAVEEGDFETYAKAQNARELARHKRK